MQKGIHDQSFVLKNRDHFCPGPGGHLAEQSFAVFYSNEHRHFISGIVNRSW